MMQPVADSIESINRAMKTTGHVTGISTGLIDLDHKLLDPVSINKKCYLIMKAMNIINILKRDIDGSISYKYICDQLYLVITIFRQLEEIILLDN